MRAKIRNIQALRFIFCMLILSCHFCGMIMNTDIFPYGGDAGVSFFFILSGFVLCLGCGRKVEERRLDELSFMRSRLCKLYPLHLFAMLIAVAFSLYLGETFRLEAFMSQLFLVQSWLLSRSMLFYGNGMSWFLGPLFLCYAIFPWLYRNIVEHRWSDRIFIVISVAYVAGYSIVTKVSDRVIDDFLYGFPPLRITDFVMGMLAYIVYRSEWAKKFSAYLQSKGELVLTICDILCVAVVVATYFAYQCLPSWFRFSMLYWIPFGLVICYFALTDGGAGLIRKLFCSRLMQWLGGISFEIYMLHIIAITIASFIYGHVIGYNGIFVPALAVFSLIVAIFMAVVAKSIEKIFNNRKNETI